MSSGLDYAVAQAEMANIIARTADAASASAPAPEGAPAASGSVSKELIFRNIAALEGVEKTLGPEEVAAKEAYAAANHRVQTAMRRLNDCVATMRAVIAQFAESIVDALIAEKAWTLEDLALATEYVDRATPENARRITLALDLVREVTQAEGHEGRYLTRLLHEIGQIAITRISEADAKAAAEAEAKEAPPSADDVRAIRDFFVGELKWTPMQLVTAGDVASGITALEPATCDQYDRWLQVLEKCKAKAKDERAAVKLLEAATKLPEEEEQETTAATTPEVAAAAVAAATPAPDYQWKPEDFTPKAEENDEDDDGLCVVLAESLATLDIAQGLAGSEEVKPDPAQPSLESKRDDGDEA